jgi:outer membrane lipoprotein-sorting protein
VICCGALCVGLGNSTASSKHEKSQPTSAPAQKAASSKHEKSQPAAPAQEIAPSFATGHDAVRAIEAYLNGVTEICCDFQQCVSDGGKIVKNAGSFYLQKKENGCWIVFLYGNGERIFVSEDTMVIKKPSSCGGKTNAGEPCVTRKCCSLNSTPIPRIFSRKVQLSEHFEIDGWGQSDVHANVLYIILRPKSFPSVKFTLFFKLYPIAKRIDGRSLGTSRVPAKSQILWDAPAPSRTSCTAQAEHRSDDPTNFLRSGIHRSGAAICNLIGWSVQSHSKKQCRTVDVMLKEETMRTNDKSQIPHEVFAEEEAILNKNKSKRNRKDR